MERDQGARVRELVESWGVVQSPKRVGGDEVPETGLRQKVGQRCCRRCDGTKFVHVSITLERCANPACSKFYRKGRGMGVKWLPPVSY